MRIYEYAKTVDKLNQEVLLKAIDIGIDVTTVSSGLSQDDIMKLERAFSASEPKAVIEVQEPKTEAPAMTLKLETTYSLDVNHNQGKHWIVVGCGGNGAYYIPQMLRQLALQNKRLELAGRQQHKVTLIDADEIEDKNLTRQNFVRNDVGKNKAEVMAQRYGRAFGLEIAYIPEYIESSEQLISLVQQSAMSPVFIGAVDNNKTRVLINGAFKHFNRAFWIDAGNEEWGGQVVCGYNLGNREPKKGDRKPQQFHLPSLVEIYPEVLEATDKLPTELSCAEQAVSNPQNIYTNMTAANLLMGFTNTILTADASQGEGLKQHSIAFNSQTMSFTTRLNTESNLSVAKEKVEA